jgi:hypothetical protein
VIEKASIARAVCLSCITPRLPLIERLHDGPSPAMLLRAIPSILPRESEPNKRLAATRRGKVSARRRMFVPKKRELENPRTCRPSSVFVLSRYADIFITARRHFCNLGVWHAYTLRWPHIGSDATASEF